MLKRQKAISDSPATGRRHDIVDMLLLGLVAKVASMLSGKLLQLSCTLAILALFAVEAAAQAPSRFDTLFEPWRATPSRSIRGLAIAPDAYGRHAPASAFPHRRSTVPPEGFGDDGGGSRLSPNLRRRVLDYPTGELAGTIIVDTANTYLYFVLGNGQAIRYGIGVGREGFTWSGRERVSRMAEWPNWRPPADMVARNPDLPDFVPGGLDNPLGARALYLGDTLYRIHGTNEPSSIGTFASSGCIRMLNADVIDLYRRVSVGTQVVVLANSESIRTR